MVVVAGWREAAAEVSLEMSDEVLQRERKQQMWVGGTEKLKRQDPRCLRLQTSLCLNWVFEGGRGFLLTWVE
jgi:hypothetical protein